MNNINKSTLLIVDDVHTNLKLLMNFLRDLDFTVQVAQDGEDALEQVAYAMPDLILLDVMMPGIDGFETCRRLKANEETRNIPIIFMTALSETVDKVKGFEIGAVDYITKPVQQEEVLARVTAHLTLSQQQKMLENQTIELQQQNNELEAFAHTVAHDLKNPLNAVYGLTGLLIDDLDDLSKPKVLKHLSTIEQASLKMANIIDALLLLASARNEEVQMKTINMVEVVAGVQQRLEQMIGQYQGQIITPTTWPIAQGYAPWIEEVWANYLSNGLKYGGTPPHLELGATPDETGYIRFWVHDNGPGLDLEKQNHLFVPFSRISQARIEGHGLGLSIVQRIVEKCGGQVGIDSQVGHGSTFYFTLPVMGNG
ncbi:MAG TPA: hybrid sensor histidine kinase/response regulator [Thioploca sp.]|nr:MAG: hybrid sensor histidine kinase/response regulator [Gammaproteobacteria bacterium]HDN26452.1 hybrid sensor histidine kinase/response regulator [Thioploca sp.]